MKVYEFAVQEGYEWVVPAASTDFEVFRAFDGSPRATAWKPVRMRLVKEDEHRRPLLTGDVPWLGPHAPVLKDTARVALGPVLAHDGELLPLDCDSAGLVAFNATTVVDALDLDHSGVVRFPSTGRIMKVTSHVFFAHLLEGIRAFKVPQLLRGSVFVTDEVVAAAAGLTGVGFRLVWEGART